MVNSIDESSRDIETEMMAMAMDPPASQSSDDDAWHVCSTTASPKSEYGARYEA